VLPFAAIALCSWQLPFGQQPPRQLIGVVRETEIRISPEINARLEKVLVKPGDVVHANEPIAVLSSPETAAAVEQARSSAAKARADRANVYAGVRQEEVNISAQNVRIAEANVDLAQQEFERVTNLARHDVSSQQQMEEDTATLASAQANLSSLRAALLMSQNGPTSEERRIADAKVVLADAVTDDEQAVLAKTMLLAPVDGSVGTIVANIGEILSPGQSTMTLYAHEARFATFTVREDELQGLTTGSNVTLVTSAGRSLRGRITELRALGEFATWKAARAVGDHDLNSFLVRVDPIESVDALEPGMTVWISR
jgi:HlyD family secretion protein